MLDVAFSATTSSEARELREPRPGHAGHAGPGASLIVDRLTRPDARSLGLIVGYETSTTSVVIDLRHSVVSERLARDLFEEIGLVTSPDRTPGPSADAPGVRFCLAGPVFCELSPPELALFAEILLTSLSPVSSARLRAELADRLLELAYNTVRR